MSRFTGVLDFLFTFCTEAFCDAPSQDTLEGLIAGGTALLSAEDTEDAGSEGSATVAALVLHLCNMRLWRLEDEVRHACSRGDAPQVLQLKTNIDCYNGRRNAMIRYVDNAFAFSPPPCDVPAVVITDSYGGAADRLSVVTLKVKYLGGQELVKMRQLLLAGMHTLEKQLVDRAWISPGSNTIKHYGTKQA